MDAPALRKRAGWLAFAFPLLIYTITLCPTVFWDDAGELIAAAYTLGIPHPPGHPLYVIIGKLFTFIPYGSIAWRVNFMSAFFGALTCMLVYRIIADRLDDHSWAPAAALGGALFFAFAPTAWEQSTVAETTTLHSFFMMLLALLVFRLASGKIIWKTEERSLCILAFLLGLSLTNHVAGVFFFPSIVCILIWKFRTRVLAPRLVAGMFLSSCAGLLVYAYLPLRSLMDPAIDWGNPENLRNFIWVITAEQYAPNLFTRPNVFAVAAHLVLLGKDLLHQFTPAGCALGLVGAWRLARTEGRILAFSLLVISILFYIGLNTAFISAYFVPAIALMAIWIGVGLQQAFEWAELLSRRIKAASPAVAAKSALCAALAATFAVPLGIHFRDMDRSDHLYALRYGEQLLENMPEGSVLFTSDGYALFILWYLTYCENKRPDLMVIDPTWLSGSGQLSSQVLEQYPDLTLPSPETVAGYTAAATDPMSLQYLVIQSILDANYERRPVFWGIVQRDLPFSRNLVPQGILFRYHSRLAALDDEALARNRLYWDAELERCLRDPAMKSDKIAAEIYPVELNNQGLMFESIGRDDLSLWAIETALSFNPEYPVSRYNLGRLKSRAGKYEEAAKEYQAAVDGNPYMSVAYYGLGNAKRNSGRYDEAFLAYRKASRMFPDYYEAITAMGRLYMLAGQHEDAAGEFRRALAIEPTYVFALRGLAASNLSMNRLDETRAALDKALELEPESAPGLLTLAKYNARIGDKEGAANALARSIDIGGDALLKEALDDADLKEIVKGLRTRN